MVSRCLDTCLQRRLPGTFSPSSARRVCFGPRRKRVRRKARKTKKQEANMILMGKRLLLMILRKQTWLLWRMTWHNQSYPTPLWFSVNVFQQLQSCCSECCLHVHLSQLSFWEDLRHRVITVSSASSPHKKKKHCLYTPKFWARSDNFVTLLSITSLSSQVPLS